MINGDCDLLRSPEQILTVLSFSLRISLSSSTRSCPVSVSFSFPLPLHSFPSTLVRFNLDILVNRKMHADLSILFKCFHGASDCPELLDIILSRTPKYTTVEPNVPFTNTRQRIDTNPHVLSSIMSTYSPVLRSFEQEITTGFYCILPAECPNGRKVFPVVIFPSACGSSICS